MIKEMDNKVVISDTDSNGMDLVKEGHVCIGFAKYNGKIVNVWLRKIEDLELIGKNNS